LVCFFPKLALLKSSFMNQKNPDANDLLKTREQEQLLWLSLSSAFASISDLGSFESAISQQLKNMLQFDFAAIGTTDANEIDYQLFYTTNVQQNQHVFFKVADGFFDKALGSPEPLKFNFSSLKNKKIQLPEFIEKQLQLGARELIFMPLHYQKNCPSVLFLFFKKPQSMQPSVERLLKRLSLPLSLSVSNLIVLQKIDNYHSDPKSISQSVINTIVMEELETKIEWIGNSPQLKAISDLAKQVAPSDSGVLILGESGTGKEIIAQMIHQNSPRKSKEMVRVNCAAIPANLIESELFGHEKGSFTGATDLRIGKFELADEGTLFLDEIGELPPDLQSRLLRVLQEKEIERIGGKKTIKVDVRIIAATNLDLLYEVGEGRFRNDLYYRLNIFPILIPPLRERVDDIALLAGHFVQHFADKLNKKITGLSVKALESLKLYSWPGNVRELKHLMERSVLLASGSVIKDVSLPELQTGNFTSSQPDFHIRPLQEIEKEYILKVVKFCNGRISGPNGAALKLGIPSTTLISKMEKLGIRKAHFSKNNNL